MGLIRVVAPLALLVACDKGKVEPAKGSAQPPPAPVPVAIDAMSIDEQLLNNTYNPNEHVFVRVCNDTGKDMADLTYGNPPFGEGKLLKGDCTGYREATDAYDYTFAQFTLGKADTFKIQPIDYVGEVPLDAGYWSYRVTVDDYAKRLASIRARKELDGSGNSSASPNVRVRACNDADMDFASLELWGVVKDPTTGLKKKTCTPYIEVDRALETIGFSFTVGNDVFEMPRATDARVKSLTPGNWSYRLTITDGRDHDARMIVTKDP